MKLTTVLIIILVQFNGRVSSKIVSCFYNALADYRVDEKVGIEDINATLCTHVVFSFLDVNHDGTIQLLANLKEFSGLKDNHKNLKLLATIGSSSDADSVFKSIASDFLRSRRFLNNLIDISKTYNLDGYDIRWMHPSLVNQNKHNRKEKIQTIKFLGFLRESFDAQNLLLTISISPVENGHFVTYDIPALEKSAHYLNLMGFDFHGSWDGKTGHNAPLDDIDRILDDWTCNGGTPSKLLLGLPFYGRTFKLQDINEHKTAAKTAGDGVEGHITSEAGLLSYTEICENIQSGWNVEWDKELQVPYAHFRDQWVGFDNKDSIVKKVQLVKQYNLAGVFVWSLENDDVFNKCGGGRYPLLTAAVHELNTNISNFGNIIPSTHTHIHGNSSKGTQLTPSMDSYIHNTTEDCVDEFVFTSSIPKIHTKGFLFTKNKVTDPTISPSDIVAFEEVDDPIAENGLLEDDSRLPDYAIFEDSDDDIPVTGSSEVYLGNVVKPETETFIQVPSDIYSSARDAITCHDDGLYADPFSCNKFYRCIGGTQYSFNCSVGTVFDTTINSCNHADLVKCKLVQ